MVYHVPESKKSIGQNLFEFDLPPAVCAALEIPEGTVYSMPKAKYLEVGVVEAMSARTDELSITDVLELMGRNDEIALALRKLDVEQLMGLMTAWQEDSGLALGESSASTSTS